MQQKEAFKFSGEDAENYDFYLGPIMFEPYGEYLASQIDTANLKTVLEIACGTGRVTRNIRKVLPADVKFYATDISNDMLQIAEREAGSEGIEFKAEDAQNLSFADNTFDLVVFQFGLMFLPDKNKGLSEIYRVLKPGGKLMLFTWDDTISMPLHGLLINELILPYFKDEDTKRFFVPFSLYDPKQLENFMETAGFKNIQVNKVAIKSGAPSPGHIVTGIFLKHSLGKEIMAKNHEVFQPLADKFEKEIITRFGAEKPEFDLSALLTVGEK